MFQNLTLPLTADIHSFLIRWTKDRNLLALLIFFIAILLFLPTLGSVGIFDSSDGYYSEGAREMIERGDLLTPVLNYRNYYEKPILNYWLIAFCYKIFGTTTFTARLPAAVCTIVLALLIFYRSLTPIGSRAAFLSSLFFLTSPIVLIVGRFSLTDMPFTLFVSAAIILIFDAVFRGQAFVLYLGYVAVGLAILTKGPVAILLVFGTLTLFLVLTTRKREKLWTRVQRFKLLPGLSLTALIAMPWYIAEHIATAGQFTSTFFIGQNMGRALGKANHTAPWFYYMILFWGSFFPWSILLATASFRKPKHWKGVLSTTRKQFIFFCSCWAGFVFIFYSCVPTKLPTYILPMYPACALLLGALVDDLISKGRIKELKISGITLSLLAGLLVICLPPFITGAISLKTLFSAKDFALSKMSAIFTGSYFSIELWAIALAVAALVYTVLLFMRMPAQAVKFFVGAMVAISICFIPLIIHHFYALRQAGFAKLVRLAKSMDKPVATVEAFQPSACFALHKHVAILKTPSDLSDFLQSPGVEHLLLVPESRKSFLLWLQTPPKVICSNGGWILVDVQ